MHKLVCVFYLGKLPATVSKPHGIWRKHLLRVMAHSLPPCCFSTGKIGNRKPPEPWRTEHYPSVWYVTTPSQRSEMKYREGSIALKHPVQIGHITLSNSTFVFPLSEDEIGPDNGEDTLSFSIP